MRGEKKKKKILIANRILNPIYKGSWQFKGACDLFCERIFYLEGGGLFRRHHHLEQLENEIGRHGARRIKP